MSLKSGIAERRCSAVRTAQQQVAAIYGHCLHLQRRLGLFASFDEQQNFFFVFTLFLLCFCLT